MDQPKSSKRMRAWTDSAVVLVLSTLLGAYAATAVGAVRWRTGADLQRRLAQPVGIVWSGNPLRRALGNLSRTQRVAVMIDRRVDPSQKFELSLDDVPLGTALEQIARSRSLGVCLLGPVAYFGPPEVTSRLRAVVALRKKEVRRLPAAVGRTFLKPQRMAWPDFSEPRELLRQLARRSRIEIDGLERVPHDLWAAADLPPLSLIDRLTLIVAQFDLTFKISPDGRRVTLVPLPGNVRTRAEIS